MPETAAVEEGLLWRLRLRSGLRFHGNEPVLARDCVASIRRWGARDSFGQTLLAATDALFAEDDQTIVFRLRTPFPQLPTCPAYRWASSSSRRLTGRSCRASCRDGRGSRT